MLARYLKAQIIVLVCGGLVGPIFLVTYFALPGMLGSFGPDVDSMAQQSTQWLLWAGALITVADVLVAVWLANRGAKSSAKSAALHQTGVLQVANVLDGPDFLGSGQAAGERHELERDVRAAC